MAQNSKTRRELTIRPDDALWEELHEQTHKRRVSKNQAVMSGLRLWLAGKDQALISCSESTYKRVMAIADRRGWSAEEFLDHAL